MRILGGQRGPRRMPDHPAGDGAEGGEQRFEVVGKGHQSHGIGRQQRREALTRKVGCDDAVVAC